MNESEFTALRDRWAEAASAIEVTHGDKDPAAKAFRRCANEIHAVMLRLGMRPTDPCQ